MIFKVILVAQLQREIWYRFDLKNQGRHTTSKGTPARLDCDINWCNSNRAALNFSRCEVEAWATRWWTVSQTYIGGVYDKSRVYMLAFVQIRRFKENQHYSVYAITISFPCISELNGNWEGGERGFPAKNTFGCPISIELSYSMAMRVYKTYPQCPICWLWRSLSLLCDSYTQL